MVYTIAGIKGDAQSRVLDYTSDEPIPRLYAAGAIGGGSGTLPCGVAGSAARGAIAGACCGKEEPRA